MSPPAPITLGPAPTTPRTAATPATTHAAQPMPAPTLPQPAVQFVQPFTAVAAASQPGEPQRLVIRLDPGELGHVQIRIDRSADGPTHIVLAVERTNTLMLLLQDRPQLDRALDAAGIPAEGRSLQFSLASSGDNGQGSGSGQRSHTPGSNNGGFSGQTGQGTPRDEPRTRTAFRTTETDSAVDITA